MMIRTSPAMKRWRHGCQRSAALLSIIVVVLGAAIHPTFATEATVATKVLNEEGEGRLGDVSSEPGEANGRDGTDSSKEFYALDDSTSSHKMNKDLNWELVLDQTSGPYLRKEDNPQQEKNNTYARPEKCILDVEIKCLIKSNDPEEHDIPAAECIDSDIHEVCFEDAEVIFEICASADDLDEGTRVNLTDASVGFRGDKEDAPIAEFTHAGKIVVGQDSMSCFKYTKHMNQCTSPVNSVVKLTGESDGYSSGCRGSAEYATSKDIKELQASKKRKPYKQAKKAFKPPQDHHSVAIQSELEALRCDVNWVSLATGGLAVAAGAVAAAATLPTGGSSLIVAVPALTGGIAAIASSTSCGDYSHPEKQFQNTEDAIRQIVRYELAEGTSRAYEDFLREVQTFQVNGIMDLDQVSEAKLQSMYSMGFAVRSHALGSDILSLQVYALTTEVQVMAQFAQLRKEVSGSYGCQVTAARIWSLLDETIKKVEGVYKKFAVTERQHNLHAECWCDGCSWFWTEGRWLAKSKYIIPEIRYQHGDCGGWDHKSCAGGDARWRCDQPIRQYRAKWKEMVDVWWWGRGKPSDPNYVMGVAKPYHELLKLRDFANGSANLAKVCGARRSESTTPEDDSTTVSCGSHRASSCNECPRDPISGNWNGHHGCNGDCDYVYQTEWRNPGKPDKCVSKSNMPRMCWGGYLYDGVCTSDVYRCCSPSGWCGNTEAHCWKPLSSPSFGYK